MNGAKIFKNGSRGIGMLAYIINVIAIQHIANARKGDKIVRLCFHIQQMLELMLVDQSTQSGHIKRVFRGSQLFQLFHQSRLHLTQFSKRHVSEAHVKKRRRVFYQVEFNLEKNSQNVIIILKN